MARATVYRRYRDKADLITAAIAADGGGHRSADGVHRPAGDLVRYLEEFDERFAERCLEVVGALHRGPRGSRRPGPPPPAGGGATHGLRPPPPRPGPGARPHRPGHRPRRRGAAPGGRGVRPSGRGHPQRSGLGRAGGGPAVGRGVAPDRARPGVPQLSAPQRFTRGCWRRSGRPVSGRAPAGTAPDRARAARGTRGRVEEGRPPSARQRSTRNSPAIRRSCARRPEGCARSGSAPPPTARTPAGTPQR